MGDETMETEPAAEILTPEVNSEAAPAKRPVMDRKAMQAALRMQNQAVIQACSQEINAILEKYGCELVATPTVEDGRIIAYAGCRIKVQ